MSEHRDTEPGEAEPVDEPALLEVSSDDRDEGWGEDARDGRRDEEWYRRERPPHHD